MADFGQMPHFGPRGETGQLQPRGVYLAHLHHVASYVGSFCESGKPLAVVMVPNRHLQNARESQRTIQARRCCVQPIDKLDLLGWFHSQAMIHIVNVIATAC